MDSKAQHVERIKLAEHQFRLACAVHLAVTNGEQSLDVPLEWTFGKHRVLHPEFALRPDQAPLAASQLEMTAMYVLMGVLRDAIAELFPNPKAHLDPRVVSAYQVSRMVRNAFSHSMIDPVWSIDMDCRGKTFTIDGIMSLDTSGLHGKPIHWPDYGGPLAVFRFGRFYKMGGLVIRKVDELPSSLVEVASLGPGESFDLGGGHVIRVLPDSSTP